MGRIEAKAPLADGGPVVGETLRWALALTEALRLKSSLESPAVNNTVLALLAIPQVVSAQISQ
ncbi:MAG: hypothetical protein CM15mP74_19860 [Halieaceae bacterium]|nr:MAG: hypothetical protein CM15mP74_19860 [Halieaceae bacterium]